MMSLPYKEIPTPNRPLGGQARRQHFLGGKSLFEGRKVVNKRCRRFKVLRQRDSPGKEINPGLSGVPLGAGGKPPGVSYRAKGGVVAILPNFFITRAFRASKRLFSIGTGHRLAATQ